MSVSQRNQHGLQPARQRQEGLTVIELMVVLAVTAIMTTIIISSLNSATQIYRLNGAALRIAGDIRYARSLSVGNSGIYGVHWGGDPNEMSPPGPSYYRLEKNTGTTCSWPAVADTVNSNANVITNWSDLSVEFPGITIASIVDNASNVHGGAAFDSWGASSNPCTGVTYPVTITVTNTSGVTKTIEVRSAGRVKSL